MDNQKFYTIQVAGVEPASVVFGFLNKDSMQPEEGHKPGKIALGVMSMPNYSKVWGKRGAEKDGKPNGKIEFLTWGDNRGEVIEIRYLPNSFSLDKQYQENTQKLKVADKDAEINLSLGLNKFDHKTQAPLINMIQHHTFNGDNKSRDPGNTNIMYIEYNPSDRIKNKAMAINSRRLAEEYVMDCQVGTDSNGLAEYDQDKLNTLAAIFELNLQDTNEILIDQLLDRVNENAGNFILVLQTKRDQAKTALVNSLEAGFVDFATEGEVNLRDGAKKNKLITGLENFDSVEEKINHLVKNFTEPAYYSAILKIQEKVKEYNTAQLQ